MVALAEAVADTAEHLGLAQQARVLPAVAEEHTAVEQEVVLAALVTTEEVPTAAVAVWALVILIAD